MAEVSIRPLLAHEPEVTPPGRWLILLLPALMAVLGICLATAAAKSGQADRRTLEKLQKEQATFYWENEAAQLKLRHGDPAEIAKSEGYAKKYRDTLPSPFSLPDRHFTGWDANRYEEILTDGYVYHRPDDPEDLKTKRDIFRPGWPEERTKNVVWFPLYPVLAWSVRKTLGLSSTMSLTVVSQASIILASIVMFLYARRHYYNRMPKLQIGTTGEAHPSRRWDLLPEDSAAIWSVAALLFAPCSIFLYANFTEPLFVLLLVAYLYCIQGRWWWRAAIIAAVASACRSQGALLGPALALVFLLRTDIRNPFAKLGIAAALGVVSFVGLGAYMLYLQSTFGDPLAFMHAQTYWNVGLNAARVYHALNPINAMTHLMQYVVTDEPLQWPRVWEAFCVIWPPVMLLILGGRFLSFELELIGWLMWALPFVSNSMAGNPPESDTWMSMGRFMSVLIPAQIIIGAVLVRFRWLGIPFLAASASAFGVFAYKFGLGEWIG